jgi:hypothetical protein
MKMGSRMSGTKLRENAENERDSGRFWCFLV